MISAQNYVVNLIEFGSYKVRLNGMILAHCNIALLTINLFAICMHLNGDIKIIAQITKFRMAKVVDNY